jgi:putative transposase
MNVSLPLKQYKLNTRFRRLPVIFADGGYAGEFVHWAEGSPFRAVAIVRRTTLDRIVVLPKRWIVARSFAGLGEYRRLSKDYETLTECTEAMILIAVTSVMLHRLPPG